MNWILHNLDGRWYQRSNLICVTTKCLESQHGTPKELITQSIQEGIGHVPTHKQCTQRIPPASNLVNNWNVQDHGCEPSEMCGKDTFKDSVNDGNKVYPSEQF